MFRQLLLNSGSYFMWNTVCSFEVELENMQREQLLGSHGPSHLASGWLASARRPKIMATSELWWAAVYLAQPLPTRPTKIIGTPERHIWNQTVEKSQAHSGEKANHDPQRLQRLQNDGTKLDYLKRFCSLQFYLTCVCVLCSMYGKLRMYFADLFLSIKLPNVDPHRNVRN